MPCDDSRAQQEEEKLLFFPGKDSANEKPWTLCLLQPCQLPFPLYKRVLLPLLCGDLYVACHGCRSQITILCWSRINPSLLERYLTVHLFQVSKVNITAHFVPDCIYLQITEFLAVSETVKTFTIFLTRILEIQGPRLVSNSLVSGVWFSSWLAALFPSWLIQT